MRASIGFDVLLFWRLDRLSAKVYWRRSRTYNGWRLRRGAVASRRRQDMFDLIEQPTPKIQELTRALESGLVPDANDSK